MELVNSKKLEAVANFIAESEVDGRFLCSYFNNSLKKRLDVPCDTDVCEDYCPFYSKENFIKWIKEENQNEESKMRDIQG
jgi:hypothetical protein